MPGQTELKLALPFIFLLERGKLHQLLSVLIDCLLATVWHQAVLTIESATKEASSRFCFLLLILVSFCVLLIQIFLDSDEF